MNPIPAILYKYMPLTIATRVLTGNRLRATPPNDFNDPFEMMPKSYSGMTDDLVYRLAEEKCCSLRYYHIVNKRLSLNVSYEAYRAYLIQNPNLIEEVAADIKNAMGQRDFSALVDQVSQTLGVLCFSADNDSILMWSHYADNHKGVVIGFDSSSLSQRWFPVQYQDERVDIPFGVSADSQEYRAAVFQILSTKFTTWGYEKECRCFVHLNNCVKETINNKDMYFSHLPPNSIKVVILGAKMPDDKKTELKTVYSGNVQEAKVDLKQFRVQI